MKNSSRFFANRECEYYPCHESDKDLNCLFCFCPLYNFKCPGNPSFTEKNGRKIKNCRGCTFPHRIENYDAVMDFLKKNRNSG